MGKLIVTIQFFYAKELNLLTLQSHSFPSPRHPYISKNPPNKDPSFIPSIRKYPESLSKHRAALLLLDSALQLRLIPRTEMLVRCHGYYINGSHQRDEASAFGCELDCFCEDGGEGGHFERLGVR